MLIWTRTPLDGTYQTRPNALDEFRLWQRLFLLLGMNCGHDLVRETKLMVNPSKNRSRDNLCPHPGQSHRAPCVLL